MERETSCLGGVETFMKKKKKGKRLGRLLLFTAPGSVFVSGKIHLFSLVARFLGQPLATPDSLAPFGDLVSF